MRLRKGRTATSSRTPRRSRPAMPLPSASKTAGSGFTSTRNRRNDDRRAELRGFPRGPRSDRGRVVPRRPAARPRPRRLRGRTRLVPPLPRDPRGLRAARDEADRRRGGTCGRTVPRRVTVAYGLAGDDASPMGLQPRAVWRDRFGEVPRGSRPSAFPHRTRDLQDIAVGVGAKGGAITAGLTERGMEELDSAFLESLIRLVGILDREDKLWMKRIGLFDALMKYQRRTIRLEFDPVESLLRFERQTELMSIELQRLRHVRYEKYDRFEFSKHNHTST